MAVKKKVAKKLVEKKCLSEVEMLKSDLLTKEMRLLELETLAITQKKKIFDLEFEKQAQKKHNEYNMARDKKTFFINELKEKYKTTKDQISYDPITGEIKDE